MITFELDKGVYYIKEDGKTLITLHYGRPGHKSPDEHEKHLNIIINPQFWGATKQFTEMHMHPSGRLYIGLDEKEAET